MKTLFILRHAKSSWENSDLSDFERPLNSRGLEEATFMGNLMYEKQIQPDLILSSPANRAKQTAILVKENAQMGNEIQYEENVYEASQLRLLQIISRIEDKNETVLLVGHNPGLEGLIKVLTGAEQPLSTASLAKIILQIDSWNEAGANCGQQEFFASPKTERHASNAE